jgi:hypothetical protein
MWCVLVAQLLSNMCCFYATQFSQREAQRKLQELSVADRIVLNTTMAIVSNQTGRK